MTNDDDRHLTRPRDVMQSMMRMEIQQLPTDIQAIYLHNLAKVYSGWSHAMLVCWDTTMAEEFEEVTNMLLEGLFVYEACKDLVVQDRVS
jgi:hypothetical protein